MKTSHTVTAALFALLLSGTMLSAAAAAEKADRGAKLLVDKGRFEILLISSGADTLMRYPVATGENAGRKRKAGDCKTPEGVFKVTWVQNTRGVMYDYHDGVGPVEAYGPYFIHLETPGFKAIGIHGTCPERDGRIGTRDSKGCIRLHNEDLLKLLDHVFPGMEVEIIPGPEDLEEDADLI